MSHPELPPAFSYVYAEVEIDLCSGTAIRADNQEVALGGQVYEFLKLLLAYPGRVLTYWQLARALFPEFASNRNPDRRHQSWANLSVAQQNSIKKLFHTLVYRTRTALGEDPSRPSILVNRMNLGYAMKPPLRTTPRPLVLSTLESARGVPHEYSTIPR
jgi:hypothetical protein